MSKLIFLILLFNVSYSQYLDIQYASFSYTIGGSYGSCVKFVKSEYSSSDYDACSCAWAANTSSYPNCYELFYNPQTKMIKYNLSEGGEYIYRNFSNDYTCHIYYEEIEDLECSEMNQLQCADDSSCNWISDYQNMNCGSYDNSQSLCEQYSEYGCSWEFSWGGWQNYGSYCAGGSFQIDNSYCEEESFLPGDINGDGSLNVSDIVLMVDLILSVEYDENSDINQDGILNIIDIIELINRILDS